MQSQELVYRALYDFNLTQLSIVAALEDMAALVEKVAYLSPEVVDSLKRHLETVGRNCDRSCDSMYSLVNVKATSD
ncbi:hypothetical protein [Pseudomonas sp. K2I15]|uniref:hypothetical protein n=1 Tax=unclassified Pseudomonas TaxID=196821 RepID=UPI000B4CE30B|nr:hypothetical protein [Pseudomonas sp. K2I15]OWP71619.1 hypothetical protein CEC48_11940 [Pseudomonas sp. K2I15]